MSRPHSACPPLTACVLPCLRCLGSRLLCRELSAASPGLYALPMSKPLRFRHSDSPQRHRLRWACVLCPSQIRAGQVTRCLVSAVAATYRLPRPCHSVFWVYNRCSFSADVDRPESQEVLVSKEACLQFGRGCLSGAVSAPFWLWLPSPACLWQGMGRPTVS